MGKWWPIGNRARGAWGRLGYVAEIPTVITWIKEARGKSTDMSLKVTDRQAEEHGQ